MGSQSSHLLINIPEGCKGQGRLEWNRELGAQYTSLTQRPGTRTLEPTSAALQRTRRSEGRVGSQTGTQFGLSLDSVLGIPIWDGNFPVSILGQLWPPNLEVFLCSQSKSINDLTEKQDVLLKANYDRNCKMQYYSWNSMHLSICKMLGCDKKE